MISLEQVISPRRRTWILATVIGLTVMATWSSVNRLRELADSDDTDIGDQSLLALAEQNVLNHLPQRVTGFRGGLSGAAGTHGLVHGAPEAKAALQGAGALKQSKELAEPKVGQTATAGEAGETVKPGQAGNASTRTQTRGKCHIMPNTDFWGEALVWGTDHKKETADLCCDACANYKPRPPDNMECNVWVYCGDFQRCGSHHKECWLKRQVHPEASKPAKEGPEVGWTTGLMEEPLSKEEVQQHASEDRRYHIVISAQGAAVHWQARVHYYWYKKIKKQCEAEGNCQMGGFTRLLHSGEPDDLMDEIPTYVVNPLPPEHPNHGYVVLNRPYAFLQWVNQVKIPEKYVLMSEPDHVWLKPMPNLMRGSRPAAFPFFYIEPWTKENLPITQRFLGPISRKEAEDIAPIGNAPTLMSFEDMKRVMPIWFNLSIAIHEDPVSSKEWGWVQEMYAFTLSCTKAGIKKIDLHLYMMSQPPWDDKLELYYLIHYTYGMDYTLQGEFTPGKYGEWRFDKRSYGSLPPPRNLGEPPVGMKNELVRHLIHAINEASNAIPGWDEYAKTGQATQLWDGKV